MHVRGGVGGRGTGSLSGTDGHMSRLSSSLHLDSICINGLHALCYFSHSQRHLQFSNSLILQCLILTSYFVRKCEEFWKIIKSVLYISDSYTFKISHSSVEITLNYCLFYDYFKMLLRHFAQVLYFTYKMIHYLENSYLLATGTCENWVYKYYEYHLTVIHLILHIWNQTLNKYMLLGCEI